MACIISLYNFINKIDGHKAYTLNDFLLIIVSPFHNLNFFSVEFLARLYSKGEETYTIEEGDRVTKVIVDRQIFKLTEEALQQFEVVHDEWELTVCQKYPHDAFVGGKFNYSYHVAISDMYPFHTCSLFFQNLLSIN